MAVITNKRHLKEAVAFAADRRGIAAVEFALLLPVMAILFFGMLEASDLFTVNRRLASATNALVDLAAQEPSITIAEVDDLIIGVTRILEPSNTSTVTMKLVSVTRGSAANSPVLVHWSRDETGNTPYTVGQTYDKLSDDESLKPGQSLVISEIGYHYDSGLTGFVISIPFDFNHRAARWPRKSNKVQLCQDANISSCTT
ncbi:MAG: TadE/TadG family type IV pilus assembly protein [Parvularculaceae bacterium]